MGGDFEHDVLQAMRRGLLERRQLDRESSSAHRQLLHSRGDRFRQRVGGALSFFRQALRNREISLLRRQDLLVQCVGIRRQLELAEALPEVLCELRQVHRLDAELAAGGMQRFGTRFDRAQGFGVELDFGGVVAKRPRRFAHLRLGRLEQLDDRDEVPIVLRQRAQLAGNGGDARQR